MATVALKDETLLTQVGRTVFQFHSDLLRYWGSRTFLAHEEIRALMYICIHVNVYVYTRTYKYMCK